MYNYWMFCRHLGQWVYFSPWLFPLCAKSPIATKETSYNLLQPSLLQPCLEMVSRDGHVARPNLWMDPALSDPAVFEIVRESWLNLLNLQVQLCPIVSPLILLFLAVISPIAGICILTVFASQCPLERHIKSAAVRNNDSSLPLWGWWHYKLVVTLQTANLVALQRKPQVYTIFGELQFAKWQPTCNS